MSSKDAAEARRKQEIEEAEFDITAVYEVCETDADLYPGHPIWYGCSRDIAETKMLAAFRDSGGLVDYLLFNHSTMENESMCLSAQTQAERGECQG